MRWRVNHTTLGYSQHVGRDRVSPNHKELVHTIPQQCLERYVGPAYLDPIICAR